MGLSASFFEISIVVDVGYFGSLGAGNINLEYRRAICVE